MDVSKYIAEFLAAKGYVKLPSLGSFVSTYQAARFGENNHALLPPCRIYSFNSTQKEADNSLVLFIAGKENTPVSVAEKEVEEYIEGCHYVINKGKRLEITGVGLLFKDESGGIVFEQDPNLVTEGNFYGLPEIKVKPPAITAKRSYNIAKIIMVVFFLAALVIAGFYAGMINTLLKEKFFSHPTQPDSTIIKKDSQNVRHDDSLSGQSTQPGPDTTATIQEKPAEEKNLVHEETIQSVEQYYIVAGAFRSAEGAERKVKQLKEKGFDAKIFGKNKQGLNLVCYSSFNSKEEAKKDLTKIKADTDANAWLIKY